MTLPRIRCAILVLAALLVSCSDSATGPRSTPELPITGIPVPQLAAFDSAMMQFMGERDKRAGTLAVVRNGVVVFERGYGWKDAAHQTPLPPDALLRLASVTKGITQAAVQKLLLEGRLNASDKVFCLQGTSTPCWLDFEHVDVRDPRLKDITVLHLLDHTAGWGPRYNLIPGHKALHVASALGVSSPPAKRDVVRFLLGLPLDYPPGTTFSYSSPGYMVLGLVVEEVTGQTYESYIQDEILNPLGIADSELEVGRGLPGLRNAREPWYSSTFVATSVYSPPKAVSMPDGGFHQEGLGGTGSLIGSARAVAMLISAYGTPGTSALYFGGDAGTFTMARYRPDGIVIVALFNKRKELASEPVDETLRGPMDHAADSITQWPVAQPVQR